MCHGQKSLFSRSSYDGYINPYYWVDDHPLLHGNNGSLDPGTCRFFEYRLENPLCPSTSWKVYWVPCTPKEKIVIGFLQLEAKLKHTSLTKNTNHLPPKRTAMKPHATPLHSTCISHFFYVSPHFLPAITPPKTNG